MFLIVESKKNIKINESPFLKVPLPFISNNWSLFLTGGWTLKSSALPPLAHISWKHSMGGKKMVVTTFEYFKQEGNRFITVEELAQEMNLSSSAYSIVQEWIRPSDGKLSFVGYTKFLHGIKVQGFNIQRQ
ncbi:CDPK-related kinase 4 [Platanthera zijinensis]|uniref:CDPK-related kinase 4 n=1 Tax=Platanthera zijinensis TaxID=2320716 RepID=A0AAP0FXB3_9ASPA